MISTQSLTSQPRWLVLAVASGAFAALNGVFAKLTTTELTTSISRGIAHFLHLPESGEAFFEIVIRALLGLLTTVFGIIHLQLFFGLNLLSNFTMWALFTRALTASPSTTSVSITNTAANFLVTAILGMVVFSEKVRGLWWLGAAMMGAGCIIVGLREGKNNSPETSAGGNATPAGNGDGGYADGDDDVDATPAFSARNKTRDTEVHGQEEEIALLDTNDNDDDDDAEEGSHTR